MKIFPVPNISSSSKVVVVFIAHPAGLQFFCRTRKNFSYYAVANATYFGRGATTESARSPFFRDNTKLFEVVRS